MQAGVDAGSDKKEERVVEIPSVAVRVSASLPVAERKPAALEKRTSTLSSLTSAGKINDRLEDEIRKSSANISPTTFRKVKGAISQLDMRRAESAAEAIGSKRNSRLAIAFACVMVCFLLLSIGSNAFLTAYVVEGAKDTTATADGTLMVRHSDTGEWSNITVRTRSADFEVHGDALTNPTDGHVVSVGVAEAHLPLIAMPVLPREELERLRAATVRVFDVRLQQVVEQTLVVTGITKVNATYVILESHAATRLVIINGEAYVEYGAPISEDDDEDDESLSSSEADEGFALDKAIRLELEASLAGEELTPARRYVCAGDATCSSFTVDTATSEGLVATAEAELQRIGVESTELNVTSESLAARRLLSHVQMQGKNSEAWADNLTNADYIDIFDHGVTRIMVKQLIPKKGTCACSLYKMWRGGRQFRFHVCARRDRPPPSMDIVSQPIFDPAVDPFQSWWTQAASAGFATAQVPIQSCWDVKCGCIVPDIWRGGKGMARYRRRLADGKKSEKNWAFRMFYDQGSCLPKCLKSADLDHKGRHKRWQIVKRIESTWGCPGGNCTEQCNAQCYTPEQRCATLNAASGTCAVHGVTQTRTCGSTGRRMGELPAPALVASEANTITAKEGRLLQNSQGNDMKSTIYSSMVATGYNADFADAVASSWCDCWLNSNGWKSDWHPNGPSAFMNQSEWRCIAEPNNPLVCPYAQCSNVETATPTTGAGNDCPTENAQDLVTQFARWYVGTFSLTSGVASASANRMLELAKSPAYNKSVHTHVIANFDHQRRRLGEKECAKRENRWCHPSHATVELATNQHVRLDELTIGERIRTPTGFEPVVGFLHAEPDVFASYHVFTTATGRKIVISDRHYLFVDGVAADPTTVKVGSMLSTPDGQQRVVTVGKEMHAGAYHLVTPSGAYYVDGVAASTYVAYVPHAVWRVAGDGYITLRYHLGLPVVPEGQAQLSLFWLQDLFRAAGVDDDTISAYAWPVVALSAQLTELACAAASAVTTKLTTPLTVGAVAAAVGYTAK